MNTPFLFRLQGIILLFCLTSLKLLAQESDIYNIMLKESLRPNFQMNLSFEFSDSVSFKKPWVLDVIKHPLPTFGFNYKQNHLFLLGLEDITLPTKQTISPYLMMPYTNQQSFDRNSTETVQDAVANVMLYPLFTIIMLDPLGLADYLMRAGVLPSDPFVPKESRKAKMLRTITRDVYHIDDNY